MADSPRRQQARRLVPPYPFFAVTGLELEYAIVDRDLQACDLVADTLRLLAGRPTSDWSTPRYAFSNELAAHVLEIKTNGPRTGLDEAETDLQAGVDTLATTLEREFGTRLLPTGMHPFLRPHEARLWSGAGRAIYETYARVFPIQSHGWLNVQSCHVNLPFGTEDETVALHNATALLIPYLPALAASSPVYDGDLGPCVDNRLVFYAGNQSRVPEITGEVIPEYVDSFRDYRRRVLAPIYRALRQIDGAQRLRHEWVNSRGAILRFQRKAIEVRALDLQECVPMDVAVAAFVRATLRWLVTALREDGMPLPSRTILLEDLQATVRSGGTARVRAPHLRKGGSDHPQRARYVLLDLLPVIADGCAADERERLRRVEARLRSGSLSEQIRSVVARRAPHPGQKRTDLLRHIYDELAVCLRTHRPWHL